MVLRITVTLGPNQLIHRCNLNDSDDVKKRCSRCKYIRSNSNRCKLRSCYDKNYCWIHLQKKYKVKIAQSRVRINGHSIGLGLFAKTNKQLPANILSKIRMNRMSKDEKKRYLIFKTGDIIGKYEGEHMTREQLNNRYDTKNDIIEPYVVEVKKDYYIDSLCLRNHTSYANDARNTTFKNNAKLTSKLYLKATKNIWCGQEIFWNYGASYFKGEHLNIKVNKNRQRN